MKKYKTEREKRKILKLPQCTLHISGTKGKSKCGEKHSPYADVKNWKYTYWGKPRLSVIHMNAVSLFYFTKLDGVKEPKEGIDLLNQHPSYQFISKKINLG